MKLIHMVMDFFRPIGLEKALVLLFAVSMFAEWLMARLKKRNSHNKKDSINNFIIGGISFSFDFIFTMLMLPIWYFMFNHFRLFHFHTNEKWVILLLFVLIDFSEYWFHRLSHQVNLLWSAHVVHHQSEYFNLTVGLRTSLFVPLFNAFFYSVFPILGFDPDTMLYIVFLQGIYQLFIHTELAGSLGFLEYIIVTPSAHRVHHGKNNIYIDKNFGKFLLLWDQLFGTHQRETEQVEYGILTPGTHTGPLRYILDPFIQLVRLLISVSEKEEKMILLFSKPNKVYELLRNKNKNPV